MQKIVPCLWFDTEAEEAARHYIEVLGEGRITDVTHYPVDTPGGQAGEVMTVEFELYGQAYTGLNGGPQFTFTEAISLQVACRDQDEIDRVWAGLVEGGQEQPCGWLKDRYGLSWQVVPENLPELMKAGTPEQQLRVGAAVMQTFGKFDLAALQRAFDGEDRDTDGQEHRMP